VATEPVHAALSAVLSRSGLPGREPLLPRAGMCWQAVAVQAAWGALVAYYDGGRDHVDVSAYEALAQVVDPVFGMIGTAAAGSGVPQTRGRPPRACTRSSPAPTGMCAWSCWPRVSGAPCATGSGCPSASTTPCSTRSSTASPTPTSSAEHYSAFFAIRGKDELTRGLDAAAIDELVLAGVLEAAPERVTAV
jgi:hypothetical protein